MRHGKPGSDVGRCDSAEQVFAGSALQRSTPHDTARRFAARPALRYVIPLPARPRFAWQGRGGSPRRARRSSERAPRKKPDRPHPELLEPLSCSGRLWTRTFPASCEDHSSRDTPRCYGSWNGGLGGNRKDDQTEANSDAWEALSGHREPGEGAKSADKRAAESANRLI